MLWLMPSSSELGGIAVPSAVRAPLAAGHAPWGRPGWTARLWLEKPGGNAGGRLADSRRDDPVAPGSIATGPLSDQGGPGGPSSPAPLGEGPPSGSWRSRPTVSASSPSVTSSWDLRDGRAPWRERHLGLVGRVEGPQATGGPAGALAAGCGCVSSRFLLSVLPSFLAGGRGSVAGAIGRPVDADVVDRR